MFYREETTNHYISELVVYIKDVANQIKMQFQADEKCKWFTVFFCVLNPLTLTHLHKHLIPQFVLFWIIIE